MRKFSVLTVTVLFALLSYTSPLLAVLIEQPGAQQAGTTKAIPGSGQDYYLRGLEALVDKDFTTAKALFTKSIDKDSTSAWPWLGLAELAFLQGNSDEAKELLDKALKVDGDDAYAWLSIGRYYYTVKQYDEAKSSFEKAIALEPDMVSAYIALGDLYNNVGIDLSKAITAYSDAVQHDPNNGGAYYALGVAQLKQGEMEQAKKSLARASELSPNNPLPEGMLGQLEYRSKRYDQALVHYNLALQRNPEYIQGHFGKHDVYVAQNDQPKAIKELESVLATVPQHPLANYKLGMIYQSKSAPFWPKAERYYLEAISAAPEMAAAYNNLAWLYLEQKENLDTALELSRKANELAKDTPQYMDTLAWIYRARGEDKSAISLLQRAADLAPSDSGLHYHLGVLYLEAGDISRAKKELELGLKSAVSPRDKERAQALLKDLSS